MHDVSIEWRKQRDGAEKRKNNSVANIKGILIHGQVDDSPRGDSSRMSRILHGCVTSVPYTEVLAMLEESPSFFSFWPISSSLEVALDRGDSRSGIPHF